MRCPRCKAENLIRGIGGLTRKGDYYFVIFDYEGNVVDASASATTILGYSREELLKMRRGDLRSDLNPAEYEMLRALILTGIGSPAFDTVHRKKNGEMLAVKLRVKVLTAEANRYALVIAKVLGIDSASEAPMRYEFSINTKAQFLYVSNPLAARLSHPWIALLGKPFRGLLKLTNKKGQESLERLLASERFFQLKGAQMLCRDGSPLMLDFSFHPHEDDYEGFEGYDVAGTVPAA
jgi:PAS domain S-box-containing protein